MINKFIIFLLISYLYSSCGRIAFRLERYVGTGTASIDFIESNKNVKDIEKELKLNDSVEILLTKFENDSTSILKSCLEKKKKEYSNNDIFSCHDIGSLFDFTAKWIVLRLKSNPEIKYYIRIRKSTNRKFKTTVLLKNIDDVSVNKRYLDMKYKEIKKHIKIFRNIICNRI